MIYAFDTIRDSIKHRQNNCRSIAVSFFCCFFAKTQRGNVFRRERSGVSNSHPTIVNTRFQFPLIKSGRSKIISEKYISARTKSQQGLSLGKMEEIIPIPSNRKMWGIFSINNLKIKHWLVVFITRSYSYTVYLFTFSILVMIIIWIAKVNTDWFFDISDSILNTPDLFYIYTSPSIISKQTKRLQRKKSIKPC